MREVINPELLKVASDNPAGLFVGGQGVGVAHCLFEDGFIKFHVERFLLDEDFGRGDIGVDVTLRHGNFKIDKLIWVINAEDFFQQCPPELLSFALLVAAFVPVH